MATNSGRPAWRSSASARSALDGVVAQQENYRRSGFRLAHRNIRYGGQPRIDAPQDARASAVAGELFAAVLAYDPAFVPAPRESFLRCWLIRADIMPSTR